MDGSESLSLRPFNLELSKIVVSGLQIMEIFVVSIMLVGFGVMFRFIRLRAALLIIGMVVLAAALLPSAGKFTDYFPLWVFWGVAIILGINLLRAVLGTLFGRAAADSFTGSLLTTVLRPVIALLVGLVRSVFRTR